MLCYSILLSSSKKFKGIISTAIVISYNIILLYGLLLLHEGELTKTNSLGNALYIP